MSSVYSVELVDKFFFHYSDEVLANIARDYLDVFQSANNFYSSLSSNIFQKERLYGDVLTTSSSGQVKIDFSKATIQGWVAQQVYEADTLIEELLMRKSKKGIVFDQDVHDLQVLEDEIFVFLDKYAVPAALSPSDLIANAQEMCVALKL